MQRENLAKALDQMSNVRKTELVEFVREAFGGLRPPEYEALSQALDGLSDAKREKVLEVLEALEAMGRPRPSDAEIQKALSQALDGLSDAQRARILRVFRRR